ncbi:unnamed protein product [Discosporangium mesarthrocarpum]
MCHGVMCREACYGMLWGMVSIDAADVGCGWKAKEQGRVVVSLLCLAEGRWGEGGLPGWLAKRRESLPLVLAVLVLQFLPSRHAQSRGWAVCPLDRGRCVSDVFSFFFFAVTFFTYYKFYPSCSSASEHTIR